MNTYFELLLYINSFEENELFTRADLLSRLQYGSHITIDNYRNWFTRSGYIQQTEKRGIYRKIKRIPWDLTSLQLRKEAYPEYYNKNSKEE